MYSLQVCNLELQTIPSLCPTTCPSFCYHWWNICSRTCNRHFAQENFRNRSTIARSNAIFGEKYFDRSLLYFQNPFFSSFWYPKSDILKEWESVNEILEKISIVQTMEKAHKVLEYCAAKSKDDMFQTSRVSKFFAEQTFKAIVLKISDNYSDVLSNGLLNQTCRQWRVQTGAFFNFRLNSSKNFRKTLLKP